MFKKIYQILAFSHGNFRRMNEGEVYALLGEQPYLFDYWVVLNAFLTSADIFQN